MGSIVGRYVMPHTVNTIPKLGKGLEKQAESTVSACKEIAQEIANSQPDTIVVISAHAPAIGNYFYVPKRKRHVGNLLDYSKLGGSMTFDNNVEFVVSLCEHAEKKGFPITTLVNDGHTRRANRMNGRLDMGTYIPLWFIRQAYNGFKLVVVSLSDLTPEEHYECGKIIAQTIKSSDGTFAIIASAELSHKTTEDSRFGYEPTALTFNQEIVSAVESGDVKKLLSFDYAKRQAVAQCGVDAINMLLGTCFGYVTRGQMLSYEHPFGVGIMAARLIPGTHISDTTLAQAKRARSSQTADKRENEQAPVILARRAIDLYLQEGVEYETPELPEDTRLGQPAGVFVSLYKNGRWRGYYGNPDPTENSAVHDIIDYAITAAIENKIGKVKREELAQLDIVVELVDEIERVTSLSDFDVTKYGMIVKYKETEGIILANSPGMDSVEKQYKAALFNAGANEKDKVRMYRFTTTRYE